MYMLYLIFIFLNRLVVVILRRNLDSFDVCLLSYKVHHLLYLTKPHGPSFPYPLRLQQCAHALRHTLLF